MIQIKAIILILLMSMTIFSCSEIFVPVVEAGAGKLVVEGLITNGNGPFRVKLTLASPYNAGSHPVVTKVSDASLIVKDNDGQIYPLTYMGSGEYELPIGFKAVTGHSYVLHIETSDGVVYESDSQVLLPSESIDSLYTTIITKEYLNDRNFKTQVNGYDVRINLFKSIKAANPMPLCRFESDVIVQYEYVWFDSDPATNLKFEWFWNVFGWATRQLDDMENITEERSKSSRPQIKDHFLCFIPKGTSAYGISANADAGVFYYYRLNQFTINEDTYQFYKAANEQLLATGKLFDPIASQLHGNMNCISDPSRDILGLFEVSSVHQVAFIIQYYPYQVPYITPRSDGQYEYKAYPDNRLVEDPDFVVIPYPSWWFHSKYL